MSLWEHQDREAAREHADRRQAAINEEIHGEVLREPAKPNGFRLAAIDAAIQELRRIDADREIDAVVQRLEFLRVMQ